MNIAVLSLTRDRLAYTQHCFQALRVNAGIEFDHFVLDQGSQDGTREWLTQTGWFAALVLKDTNIGIPRGMNRLLNLTARTDYDVIVKIDNDCELTEPDTLRQVCELALEGNCILSPRILGLNHPPKPTRELRIRDTVILDVPQIGGIFLAAPAWVYDEFRYDETLPVWGGDDIQICRWFRTQGGTCGYVKHLEAWHYRTTAGQHDDHAWYFDRRVAEGAPA